MAETRSPRCGAPKPAWALASGCRKTGCRASSRSCSTGDGVGESTELRQAEKWLCGGRISSRGVRFRLPKALLGEQNRPSSNRVGAAARPAIRTAWILALVLGAFLVLTEAAVAGPTPTAPFSPAATATPSSLSALGHNVAGMGFAEAQRRPKTGNHRERGAQKPTRGPYEVY
jgi:hypothetical protein